MSPKVSIIILNWNGADDTIKCVNSFSQLEYPQYDLVVVDNKSTDDSAKRISATFPAITLIATEQNLGYTGGNNVGIRHAMNNGADYVLIVNNDTELLNPMFLKDAISQIEKAPNIGILGPKVLNPGGIVQKTILFTPTLNNAIRESILFKTGSKKEHDYNVKQDVEAVCGVCWLIRKKVVEDVGLLDEDYFMYAEEQDYCFRAKKGGWKIVYHPVESVLHKKGPEDENEERTIRQYIYARRNLVLFLYKHFGFMQALMLSFLFIMSNILKTVLSRLASKENNFYNTSLLMRIVSELKYVLSGKWRTAGNTGL